MSHEPEVHSGAFFGTWAVMRDAGTMNDESGVRVVPADELGAEERSALGWAVSIEHPVGTAILERVRTDGAGVTTAELAVICNDWVEAGRPLPERHVHRTPVVFEDGTAITGVSFVADDPYARDTPPSFGLYLDESWSPPWPHAHLDWPDFRLPTDVDAARSALSQLVERARRGDSVEVGCVGGHGRTGTALACIAVMTGTPATDAVAWVRTNYCDKAVETDEQEAFASNFAP